MLAWEERPDDEERTVKGLLKNLANDVSGNRAVLVAGICRTATIHPVE